MPEWGVAQALGQRESQQDSHAAHPLADALLVLVADGMGGHADGGQASDTVARAFTRSLAASAGPWPDRLRDALDAAQADLTGRLGQADAAAGAGSGAGTTLVAAVIERGQVWHISVGDSILALVEDGTCQRLNADHSMLPLLERQHAEGLLDAEDLAVHPLRNQLRSAIMAGGVAAIIDCPQEPTPLAPGASLLLMSDGMAGLDTPRLAATVAAAPSAADAAAQAIAHLARLDLPGQDNATLLVVRNAAPPRKKPGLLLAGGAALLVALALAAAWLARS